ncbi:hypothetical protein HDF26_000416 [Pedobacter cryoconitis]|uniref:Uncharacterized protein n=1 Tax=Pedobacter cryoconitis TaxID=188932 RepID=A0A7W8ZPI0_9SPHI|nr:hypothetical protein [Pedobacter cryoconitis]MBB5637562.1 hypothetical protein [Pedobacter cryoconitis]MBB6269989.1 hypothetical protein [Pedobacter cryoconitis]
MNLTKEELVGLAESIGIEYAALMAFISVETGDIGFSKTTPNGGYLKIITWIFTPMIPDLQLKG